MIKNFKKNIKNLINKLKIRIKLKLMDEWWYMFDPIFRDTPYPPSFYYYHTPEEIRQIQEEELKETARLRTLVEEMGRMDDEARLRDEICKMETEFRKIETNARKKKSSNH